MTRSNVLWGLASAREDIRKSVQTLGKPGIAACDSALADPVLVPAFWLRRANLLQAKAGHLIASGSAEEGLKVLAESDAVAAANGGGPLFDRSLANGNRALRAFAYQALWRADDARKEIAAIKATRKWAPLSQSLAVDLENRLDPKKETYLKSLKAAIPLTPNVSYPAFWMSLGFGLNDWAADFAPHVNFSMPKARGGYVLQGAERERYDQISERAKFAGAHAYALAATGKGAVAKTVIEAARQTLLEAAEPPPPPKEGKKLSKHVQYDFEERKRASEKGARQLRQWESAIALRDELPKLSPNEAFKLISAKRDAKDIAVDLALGDMMGRIRADSPEDRKEKKAFLDGYFGALETEIGKVISKGPSDFMGQLPRAETPELVPSFKKAGDGYFLSDNGLSHRLEDDGKTHLVRFTHVAAVKETIEEMALLGAARLAKAEGKDSLLILFRTIIARTQSTSYYGRVLSTVAMGHEAQMRVLFLDSKALPADQEPFRWRLVPVDQVIADLEPRYMAAAKAGK